ncbi:hypothetical protein [Thalassotalea piscium]|uniref:SGNH/GDSL hydrolase family protein n=1 Tax=Thalassotalea piscium TaxID=1230533 RepID=A0A7X0NH43_9GAMM|nr:hypothetical protein [Thalassotalea piscium]MBB6543371.1 hypothetical protein [Thalassotalea piscium]
MRTIYSIIIIVFYLTACSGGSNKSEPEIIKDKIKEDISVTNLAIPDNRFSNTYEIVLFGNSHTAGLGTIIKNLINVGNPYAAVNVVTAGGGFLDNQATKQSREVLLNTKPWTHIILQGQKYSESGAYIYPTAPTKEWIAKAKKNNITPILFPEHPRKGNTEEATRIHLIHTGISASQRACVAPVGLAWDNILAIDPQIPLHSSDGNHASLLGRLFTAYIFYEVITGESADSLPYIEDLNVDEPTQQFLKQFASEAIAANQPCNFES